MQSIKHAVVLVETRRDINIVECLNRHLPFLNSEEWVVRIYTTEAIQSYLENAVAIANLFKHKIIFSNIISINTINDYNYLLTSESFWQTIPEDKCLIIQHDSALLRRGIEEFLEWDYVGAPWKFQHHGGNGGLSLRSTRVMEGICSVEKYNRRFDGNEDVFFCNILTLSEDYKLAPRKVCKKFSVECIFELGTLGYHAINKYLTQLEINQVINQYSTMNQPSDMVQPYSPLTLDLIQEYVRVCSTSSDINLLLPILTKFTAGKVVVELGVRNVVSTYAFLISKPESYFGYDIHKQPEVDKASTLATKNNIKFSFQEVDVLDNNFSIPVCDVLFIDTLHIYNQLKRELDKFAPLVREYILLHDTVTYGYKDEPSSWQTPDIMKNYNIEPTKQGLMPAIEEFLTSNTSWKHANTFTHSNGLTVLKRFKR